jgi:tetratricopeptide (TPR) repeat protein
MSRPRAETLAAVIAALAAAAGLARAQPGSDFLSPQDSVEVYMQDRELVEPLAAMLRQRLAEATGNQRREIADRLGKIYVMMLDAGPSVQRRQEIEELCRNLLTAVPDAETFELRVNLARASYLPAAETAEKVQLRLATTEERLEAERVLRNVAPTLREVATSVSQRVESLERKSRAEPEDDRVREALVEARRVRSLAHYYAGWSEYYLSLLTADAAMAMRASEDFGVLLGTTTRRPAAVDKAPKSLFRYEHVARAAIGAALSASLRGNDIEAMRWIDAVEVAESVPPAVGEQLFSTKLTVLAAARRWADIDLLTRRRKIDTPEHGGGALTARDARLLAVLAMEAGQDSKTPERSSQVIADLAKLAVSELVSMGELGQVVDLVNRYGSAPIGGNGFAVQYVQGVQAYENARRQHRETSQDPESPTELSSLANRYREASNLLGLASAAPDAAAFSVERERAQINQGLALFYAGDLEQAAEVFRRIAATTTDDGRRLDAAWYAIVAIDRAIERGRPSLAPERDRLAMNFIRQHPDHERSVRLLLRRGTRSTVNDEEAAAVLLAVMPDSPVFDLARLEAAGLLYKLWLSTPPEDRQAAGLRLLTVAEDSMAAQLRRLSGDVKTRENAAAGISRLARQIAHVALTMPDPDPTRALAALDRLDQAATVHEVDLKAVDEELLYRRLQAALLLSDRSRAEELITRLRAAGGVYAAGAERLVYRQLAEAWKADPANLEAAADLVTSGTILADSLFKDAATVPLSYAVAGETADAAIAIWQGRSDISMRDVALRLDRRTWDAGVRSLPLCRRLAMTSESAGQTTLAVECWAQLSAALEEGSVEWFEARYEAIRLLRATDQAAATQAMKQLLTLYPELGPEPWRGRLRTLAGELSVDSAAPQPGGGR